MKRLLIFTFYNLLFISTLYSNHVDTITAKIVARNFYLSRVKKDSHFKSTKNVELSLIYTERADIRNQHLKSSVVLPIYYIYNLIIYSHSYIYKHIPDLSNYSYIYKKYNNYCFCKKLNISRIHDHVYFLVVPFHYFNKLAVIFTNIFFIQNKEM